MRQVALGRIVIAVCAVAALLVAPDPVLAQSKTRGSTIELASQTPWVGPGGDFTIRLNVAARDPDDVEIAVTLFQRIVSRSAFEQSLEGRLRGSVLSVSAPELSELTRDAAGAVTIRIPLQNLTEPRDPKRVHVAKEGVYPVKVELRETGGGVVFDGFTTHLVHIPDPVRGSELGAVVVLPVHAPPGLSSDGSRHAVSSAGIAALASSLGRHQQHPLVLSPTPETLESLAMSPKVSDHELLRDLVDAKQDRQVLVSSYVPIDLPAMLAAGLGSEVSDQLGRGAEALASVMHERADPRTRLVEINLNAAALDLLRDQQVDRVIVPETAISASPLTVTLAQPFLLEDRRGNRPVDALATDHYLSSRFDQSDGAVLAAHRLLADLAVVFFERPGVERVVVASPPRAWKPTTSFLDALLDGLDTSPIVRAMNLDEAFSSVPAATTAGRTQRPLVRKLVETTANRRSLPAAELRAGRAVVDSFGAIVDPDNGFFASLDRMLLIAGGSTQSVSGRRGYISGARSALTAELAHIHLPANRAVTLTARGGEIPVTIRSELSYPVRAVLRVESDKLTFPGGASRQMELTRQNTTQRFRVEARTSGTFPLRVVLASTDGRLTIAKSLVTVRSTAASNVGFVLSGGAGGFLMLWWGRNIRRSRRRPAAGPGRDDGE